MLPKMVKKALKHIYQQPPIRHYMDSMTVYWHKVYRSETMFTRFIIFTYGDDTKDFESLDELQWWARDEYEASRARIPAWDCSGLALMWDYRVIELPKLGNACAVIFKYSVDV